MRSPRFLLASLALGTVAYAQSPFTTTFASNNGQAGNMFDIVAQNPAGITVDYFDVNLDAGNWDMEVYVLTLPGTFQPSTGVAADWTLVGSATGVASNGPNVPTLLPISVCTHIPAGSTQAFYVTCTNGTGINYTTGSGIAWGDIYASNADLDFIAGSGNVYPFGAAFGGATSSRIWNGNIYYNVGNDPSACSGAFASKQLYGTGCYQVAASYYEVMDAASMDLGGLAVTGTSTGSGYDITTGPATINPIGFGATALTLGDDVQVDTSTIGGTLGLHVGSNCWVAFGAGNSNGFAPSVGTMLGNPSTAIYAWTDLQPNATGSGLVHYEESGSVATVTYDGVFGWGTTDPNTIQFTIDTATGDYTIAFGTLSANNPEDWLVGFSTGGASVDPGATDISAGPFSVAAADGPGLALDATPPLLGSIWSVQLDNIDPNSPFAVFAFGDADIDPGFDLTPVGGPGCFLYTNANLGFFTQPMNGTSSSINVLLPNLSALLGAFASAQGAGFTPLNSLTFATSNGLRVIVGN